MILFVDPSPPKKVKVKKAGPIKFDFKRPIRHMDMRRMYFYRYGTEGEAGKVLMSYAKIARKLYLPISTVY